MNEKIYLFAYGILQLNISAAEFELNKDNYIGRGILAGYMRKSLCSIEKNNLHYIHKGKKHFIHYVCGDIFYVDKDIEDRIWDFERSCGYERITETVRCVNDNKKYKCVVYV